MDYPHGWERHKNPRKELVEALERKVSEGLTLNGEFVVGLAFNYLIKKGLKIYPVPVIAKHDLGNVEDIQYFSKGPFVC